MKSKNIMIDRQLFFDIFDYFTDHGQDLPEDDRLPRIREALADKYLRDDARERYGMRLQYKKKFDQ